jgi:hypothetical protein
MDDLDELDAGDEWDSRPLAAESMPLAPRRTSPIVLTVALALALAALGVGGVQAAALLRHAIRPPGPSDLATQICSELKAKSYDQLASQIDSSPDSSQQSSNVADPQGITGKLRSLDDASGTVTSCAFQQLSYADSASHGAVANFSVLVQREKQGNPQALLLILVQKSDGTWKVARSSNLTPGA